MRRFSQLLEDLHGTPHAAEKAAALRSYFGQVPAADAAWALWFLLGRRIRMDLPAATLRHWAATWAGLPQWLVDASMEAVGDLAEGLALLPVEQGMGVVVAEPGEQLGLFAPAAERGAIRLAEWPLQRVVEEVLMGIAGGDRATQARLLRLAWQGLLPAQRWGFNKLLLGRLGTGVPRSLLVEAVAAAQGWDPARLERRLVAEWQPSPAGWDRLGAAAAEVASVGRRAEVHGGDIHPGGVAKLVLVAGQEGHGQQAGWYSEGTFAAWQGQELVTVGKATLALAETELREIDGWVREHRVGKFGRVCTVAAELVFEVAYAAVKLSGRHKSGLVLYQPQVLRWGRELTAADADAVAPLRLLAGLDAADRGGRLVTRHSSRPSSALARACGNHHCGRS